MLHPVTEQAHQPLSSGYSYHQQISVQHKSRERDNTERLRPILAIDHLDLPSGKLFLNLIG